MFRKVMAKFTRIARNILIGLIKTYRYVLSPFVGYHCRFYPTCSAYALDAVNNYGAIRGGWLSLLRLCRCHPWHEGGVDPVPPKEVDNENHGK